MKKLNLLILAILLIGFSSCKDEDPTAQELIIGTWNIDSIATTLCADTNDNGSQVFGDDGCITFGSDVYCVTGTMVFTAPDVVVFTVISTENGTAQTPDVTTGTYSFEDDGTLKLCLDGECPTGTLTVTDSAMTWSGVTPDMCTTTLQGSK